MGDEWLKEKATASQQNVETRYSIVFGEAVLDITK